MSGDMVDVDRNQMLVEVRGRILLMRTPDGRLAGIHNGTELTQFIKFGEGASPKDFTLILQPDHSYEWVGQVMYTGPVTSYPLIPSRPPYDWEAEWTDDDEWPNG